MTERVKIFVSAYACEPDLGSEIGVGWHWVVEMSKYFQLWVLTRKSNQAGIERWMSEHPEYSDIHFIYFDLPHWARFWKKGLRGVRTYYVLWQKLTNRIVRNTMEANHIEIYHLLTYGNALWPASKYGQSKTFIWGPTATGTIIPREFTRHYGFKNRLKEDLQRLMASTLRYNSGYQSRCKDADLILCKTELTREAIAEKYRNKAVVFTDVAVELLDTTQYKPGAKDEIVRYLAVGRLDSWRGFDLMIEAFAKAVARNKRLHLDILGRGNDMERLKSLVSNLSMDSYIRLHGQVSMRDYYQFMAECDVVVNPTLKEGAVTTAFESMSFAKPLICVDTGGYTRYFSNDYSVILKMDSRESLVENLSKAIVRLTDGALRDEMAQKLIKVRGGFTWQHKGEQIRDMILQTINK